MRAPLFVIQGLADLFHEGSAIVNVASMEASHVVASTGRTTTIYASTKAALKNLTETLAAELGPRGIRVNAVAPGLIVTRLTTGMPSETRDWFNRLTPLGDGSAAGGHRRRDRVPRLGRRALRDRRLRGRRRRA